MNFMISSKNNLRKYGICRLGLFKKKKLQLAFHLNGQIRKRNEKTEKDY